MIDGNLIDTTRIKDLGLVERNPQELEKTGVDLNAVGKIIHNAYLARRVHNPEIPEPVLGSVIKEVENPKYHNEPTPDHIIFVGSIMRNWTGYTEVGRNRPNYVLQTLGYDQSYPDRLLNSESPNDIELAQELSLKREIFLKVKEYLTREELDLSTIQALVLWGYFHDLGKIFRPYIKGKDNSGSSIKHENALNEFTSGFTPPEEDEHEWLDSHTFLFIELFKEAGVIKEDICDLIIALHQAYEVLSFSLKKEKLNPVATDHSEELQKLAVIALAADELGKGIAFSDKSGHSIRLEKLKTLNRLVLKL